MGVAIPLVVTAFGSAMVGSLFSSDAWNNVTFAAAEVRRPERNLPLALALARVYFAMARDGLFFAPAGALNRNGVSACALVAQGVWTALLTLTGTYGQLLD